MLVDGYLVLGAKVGFTSDLHLGLEHLDRGIEAFRKAERSARRFPAGNHAAVSCFTTSAFYLWVLGCPDRALERAQTAVEVARSLEHPYSMAYAFYHCGLLRLWRREYEQVIECSEGMRSVTDDHNFPIWRALGRVLRGAGTTGSGDFDAGLAEIDQGRQLYEGLRTPPVFFPMLLFLQAGACSQAGRTADGIALIDRALDAVDHGSGMMLVPEMLVLSGDLRLASGDSEAAEALFQRGLEAAVRWDARMSQLRAAVRLGRLLASRGRGEEGRRLVSPIHATFTEGKATLDLKDATEFLASV